VCSITVYGDGMQQFEAKKKAGHFVRPDSRDGFLPLTCSLF